MIQDDIRTDHQPIDQRLIQANLLFVSRCHSRDADLPNTVRERDTQTPFCSAAEITRGNLFSGSL